MENSFINISGNIASGATTLSRALSKILGWVILEDTSPLHNRFLPKFYEDPNRWAFHNQVNFLVEGFSQNEIGKRLEKDVCIDYTIYEHNEVYASAFADLGFLTGAELDTLTKLFNLLSPEIRKPDLLIYVKAGLDTLRQRIAQRGRMFESRISSDYLRTLQRRFDTMISEWTVSPVLQVDSEANNFFNREVISEIASKVQHLLSRGNESKTCGD